MISARDSMCESLGTETGAKREQSQHFVIVTAASLSKCNRHNSDHSHKSTHLLQNRHQIDRAHHAEQQNPTYYFEGKPKHVNPRHHCKDFDVCCFHTGIEKAKVIIITSKWFLCTIALSKMVSQHCCFVKLFHRFLLHCSYTVVFCYHHYQHLHNCDIIFFAPLCCQNLSQVLSLVAYFAFF